jgi:hypothetical protein
MNQRQTLFGYAARFVHSLPISGLLVYIHCTDTDSSRATARRKQKSISASLESSIPQILPVVIIDK